MSAVTFVCRQRSRASELFGASDLVYRETVHADGRVEWSVRGTSDGEHVNQSGVREHGAVDLARVTTARLSSGWSVAS